MKHAWKKCIAVGRGYDLLRADLQEHLRFLQKEIGYEMIRFHAGFHDDVGVVHRNKDGKIVYRWTQLDKIYDFLVDAGFNPIFEINPMPLAISSGAKTMFWYKMNVTPPRNFQEWEDFIRAWIEHFAERYGIERLRNWYFEVWNEPNLHNQFCTGDQLQYFELYASCARVLKAFDKGLRIGGPAGAGPAWNLLLAKYCRDNNVPLDFISWHSYPQGEACVYHSLEESPYQPGMCFVETMGDAKRELADAGFGHLPILMTEWNTQAHEKDWKALWVGNEYVSNLFGGAAVCHLATSCDNYVDVLAWWVASDVFEEAGPHFSPYGRGNQYYEMLTAEGLPKAAFHGFKFLSRMNGPRYDFKRPDEMRPTCGLLVTDESSATRAFVWNCCFPHGEMEDCVLKLRLPAPRTHLDEKKLRVISAKVTEGQGSAYEFWKSMGYPPNLTKTEQEALRQRSQPYYNAQIADNDTRFVNIELALKANEFVFLEIGGDKVFESEEKLNKSLSVLNEQLML